MGPLLKMNDETLFKHYNTPTRTDSRFLNYSEMKQSDSSPFENYRNSSYGTIGRGSHPVNFKITKTLANNTFEECENEDAIQINGDGACEYKVEMSVNVIEPLLFMAPFLAEMKQANNGALYNIQNLNLNFTLNVGHRLMSIDSNYNHSPIRVTSITNSKLYITILAAQSTDQLAPLAVYPYHSYDRHIKVSHNLNAGASTKLQSDNITYKAITLHSDKITR